MKKPFCQMRPSETFADQVCRTITDLSLSKTIVGDPRHAISLEQLASFKRDAARLDKLDKMRRVYSRPPFRAVTGWEWSVVSEHGDRTFAAENVRSAIDNMEEPT